MKNVFGVAGVGKGMSTHPLAYPLVAGGDGRALVGHARRSGHLRCFRMTMAVGVSVGVAVGVRMSHSLGVEVRV